VVLSFRAATTSFDLAMTSAMAADASPDAGIAAMAASRSFSFSLVAV
jgi:hypothetical protein